MSRPARCSGTSSAGRCEAANRGPEPSRRSFRDAGSAVLTDEVTMAGAVEQVRGEAGLAHEIAGDGDELIQDVARMAHPQRTVARPPPLVEHVLHGGLIERHAARLADKLHD